MSDRRLTPANARVADQALAGTVTAARFVAGDPMRVIASVADLCASPGGARDRQLLLGAAVTCYDIHDGWAFVRALTDGYVGYVASDQLGPQAPVTHRVATRATHAYSAADIKSPETAWLSFGSQIQVFTQDYRFAHTALGHIPASHLRLMDDPELDPVDVAQRVLGAPYLWGGNSSAGIDCSGLVQMALQACGKTCPGDSDMQEAALGATVPPETPPQRGDLLFWKGHVAWVADKDMLLHANAFHMAVAFEPLTRAIQRIADQGDGPVTRHARLSDPQV